MLDFSTDTLYDTEEAERLLSREIQRAQGFSLVFAVSGGGRRSLEHMALFRSHYPDLKLQHFDLREETPDLLGLLREHLKRPAPDAVFVTGVEFWTSGDLDQPVSPFIANLNRARNSFAGACPCPLVFWIPEFLLGVLSRKAPDFFSVRSGVHYFSAPMLVDKAEVFLSTGMMQWGKSTPQEREERMSELEELLASVLAEPEKERDLAMQLRLLKRLAEVYMAHGDYEKSADAARAEVKLSRDLLGENHLMTGGAYNDLGLAYLNAERYPEAERQLRKALEIAQKCDQKNNNSLSLCLNNLANVCLHQNNKAEAKRLLEQSLKIQQAKSQEPHLSLAYCRSHLAGIEQTEGHYQKAEDYQKQVVSIFKRLLPEDHVDIGISLGNLATIYGGQGKFTEAEKAFSEALAIAIPVLGENHPITKAMWESYQEFQREREIAPAS